MTKWIKKYWQLTLFGLLFAVVLYSLLMSRQLTNTFDGLWNQSYRHAGAAELASGRWMLFFIDKLNLGLHADPVTSVAALLLFTLAFPLLAELFGLEKRLPLLLSAALFLCSTAVGCTLSYRMTSLAYALAFLLAAAGVFAAVRLRRSLFGIAAGGGLLCLSLACYQAELAVYCVIAVFYLIFLCCTAPKKERGEKSQILAALLRLGGALLAGLLLYLLTLLLFLALFRTSLSDYNGGGSLSLPALILGLPANVFKTFRYFGVYFLKNTFKLNRLQQFGGLYVYLALLAALLLTLAVRTLKTDRRRAAAMLLLSLLLPVACSAYMLIAGDKLELQMSAGLALMMPLTALLAFRCLPSKRLLTVACALLCAAFVYGGSMQVLLDQEAMYEGQNACDTMMTQVISDLDREGLLGEGYEYCFVGVPARNPYFSVSDAYVCANGYAQMGNFWSAGNCTQMSYQGLLNKRLGFGLPVSYRSTEELASRCSLSALPCFPEAGYITVLDGRTVIVKIAEPLPYGEFR